MGFFVHLQIDEGKMVPSSRRSQYTCAHLLFAALLCVHVNAHGFMFEPASRNWLGRNSNPVITYTPHGGNGRGESSYLSSSWHKDEENSSTGQQQT